MGLHADVPEVHEDGTKRFSGATDLVRQGLVAQKIEERLKVKLIPVGELSYLDYLVVRYERPIAWAEIIERAYTYEDLMQRGGVWLKRKTYMTALCAAGVPLSIRWQGAFIFWQLIDGLYWASAIDIDPQLDEAFDPRGATNDTEPALLVKDLHWLGG